MSAFGGRVQRVDATPSNLTREGGVRWRGLHEYGSRRSRGLSFGSAGRTVNVWRISLGRLRGGTRAVSIVSWLSMVALLRSGAGELRVSIRERPAEAKDRAVPGHWEGDLLTGTNNSHIATLVERHTRFVMLLKIPSRDTATVVGALTKQVRKLPQQLRRSLTWDRGKEMADHKSFTVATNVQVYFCDPHSPWQRGSNRRPPFLIRICQ